MQYRPHFKFPAQLLAAILILGSHASHAASSLKDASPFIPDGWLAAQERRENARDQAKPTPPPAPQIALERVLEFRGAFRLGNTWRFNIANKKTGKSEWISEKSNGSEIRVNNYNAETNEISVTFEGRTEKLTINSPTDKVQSVQVATNAVTAAGTSNRQPIAINPTPAGSAQPGVAQQIAHTNTAPPPSQNATNRPTASTTGAVVSTGPGSIPKLTIGNQNTSANTGGDSRPPQERRVTRRRVIPRQSTSTNEANLNPNGQ